MQPKRVRLAVAGLMLFFAWHLPAALAAGDPERDQRWREDLAFLIETVTTVHPEPFFQGRQADFEAAAGELEVKIAELSDPEIAVAMMRLTAIVEDGHTGLFPFALPEFQRHYPVRIVPFEDGLFVVSAAVEHAGIVGTRVTAIGELPAAEALERVLTVANGDNDLSRLDRAPMLLTLPPVLHALGIAAEPDRVRISVETAAGETRTAEVTPVPGEPGFPTWYFAGDGVPGGPFVTASDGAAAPLPLHRRGRDKPYWFEYLPEQRLLYLAYHQVGIDPSEPFRRFLDRLFGFTAEHPVDKLVIDLRHNHGGNNRFAKPLIHALIKHDDLSRRGRLFVVVGRGTFSAAVNAATWLEEDTQALFVGEPTGAGPNHFGDAEELRLPHSGLTLYVSAWRWQEGLPWDARRWIAPQVAAPPVFAAWRENRDPALEAVLAFEAEHDLRAILGAAVAEGGAEAVAEAYHRFKQEHPDRWGRTSEGDVNQVGYALLGEGKQAEAIAIFALNASSYPESANAWDSLAEAHLAVGDRERAVELYRKALEVDPDFFNARRMLRQLGSEPAAGHGD